MSLLVDIHLDCGRVVRQDTYANFDLVPEPTHCRTGNRAMGRFQRIPRQRDTEWKLAAALDLYPCDLLFVHRDAENQPPELRRREIASNLRNSRVKHVPSSPFA